MRCFNLLSLFFFIFYFTATTILFFNVSIAGNFGEKIEISGVVKKEPLGIKFKMKEYDAAFEHFKRSLFLSETMSNYRRTALIQGIMGERYSKVGKQGDAAQYLNESISLSLKHGHSDLVSRFSKTLKDIQSI